MIVMAEQSKILVPVGFSEQSLLALEDAILFAKTLQSDLVLLSVIEENAGLGKLFGDTKARHQTLREEVLVKLDELAKATAASSGLKVETMVAFGVVYEEIARVAEMISASMVVMGTNGKPSNLRRRFIGSNAYRTTCITSCPVVTIKGIEPTRKIENIIFPIVMDRKSKEKVGMALHFGRKFGARISAVAVPKVPSDVDMLRLHLKQVSQFINDHGVECSTDLLEPRSSGAIKHLLEFTYQKKGDVIMIMEEGAEPDLADMLLGNDVQQVIYHSEVPVISITPSQTKWEALFQNW
ncbi:hypothetical protein GC167_01955 [bacterium]|nr:hypothetical protein [bacterium]